MKKKLKAIKKPVRAAGKALSELDVAFGGDAKELVVVHKDDFVLS